MSKELIRLRDLTMEFDGERILDSINLYINDHEFLTLLGPSGCGKTTTLRIIGGFLTPTSGTVTFDGQLINDVPPYKRQINTVFQRYALFPHLNVFDNIAFGLRVAKVPREEINERVNRMLEIVSLKGYGHRNVSSLSGGQQQRVAIARALVNEPKVLLLDEPLGALDLRLRKDMQIELKRIQQATGITFIYVTHDQEEALSMSDTVVVMDKGRIQQIGRPEDIYNEPKNAFVADFIGESNILDGVMLADYKVRFFGRTFECVDTGFAPNEPVDVVIRPEDIDIVEPEKGHLVGTVTSVTFKGLNYEFMRANEEYSRYLGTLPNEQAYPLYKKHYEDGLAIARQYPAELGEIVERPVDRRENYVKRCVGLPGNTLEIKDKIVYIDGKPMDKPENLQFNYNVKFRHTMPERVRRELGISKKDLADFQFYKQAGSDGSGELPLTLKSYEKLKNLDKLVESISIAEKNSTEGIYPLNGNSGWTLDNYGPIWIPKRGESVKLDMDNIAIYERPIVAYEGNTLEVKDGKIYINGKESDSYTFKMDYYWMMGDNRHNSADSRCWGFVPEDHIVGKALFIWLSLDEDRGLFDGKIRWNRLFRGVNSFD